MKSIREFDAHLTGHGAEDKVFERVHGRFITLLPSYIAIRHQKPSEETLQDKLGTMITVRKSKNRTNVSASGISETVTEEDQLLDDFVLDIEEKRLQRKQECDQLSHNEKRLVAAGE